MLLNKLLLGKSLRKVLFKPPVGIISSVSYASNTLKINALKVNVSVHNYSTSESSTPTSQVNTTAGTTSEVTKERERLEKFIRKSKLLARLNKNPRFNGYFERLRQVGAVPTITSFFILHELTAAIPLLICWYLLYHLDLWDDYNITESSNPLLIKCGHAIERMVGDKYETLDKHRLVITGAISYAVVKVFGPLRLLASLWAAPYFGKYLILPFYKLKPLLKRVSRRSK